MLIGILETGRVHEDLVEQHGDYPTMFERLLRTADPALQFRTYPVLDGVFPDRPTEADAWLVPGSKWGVYDELPWIDPLIGFLRDVRGAGVPVLGVCFGHQIMAMAYGGHAQKSDRGWGIGVHAYVARSTPAWMSAGNRTLAFHAMHQDQVTAIPGDATVLAASEFCPFAMLAYGDPDTPDAISIQPHPEFDAGYGADLVRVRTGPSFGEKEAAAALETYGTPVDNDAFADWAVRYLKAAKRARAAA